MKRRNELDIQDWGDDFSDEKTFGDYLESTDIDNIDVSDAIKDTYADEDKVLFLTAAGMGLAILAGYGVKRALKKRKA